MSFDTQQVGFKPDQIGAAALWNANIEEMTTPGPSGGKNPHAAADGMQQHVGYQFAQPEPYQQQINSNVTIDPNLLAQIDYTGDKLALADTMKVDSSKDSLFGACCSTMTEELQGLQQFGLGTQPAPEAAFNIPPPQPTWSMTHKIDFTMRGMG